MSIRTVRTVLPLVTSLQISECVAMLKECATYSVTLEYYFDCRSFEVCARERVTSLDVSLISTLLYSWRTWILLRVIFNIDYIFGKGYPIGRSKWQVITWCTYPKKGNSELISCSAWSCSKLYQIVVSVLLCRSVFPEKSGSRWCF